MFPGSTLAFAGATDFTSGEHFNRCSICRDDAHLAFSNWMNYKGYEHAAQYRNNVELVKREDEAWAKRVGRSFIPGCMCPSCKRYARISSARRALYVPAGTSA